jgi:hypothetical protein
MREFVDRPRLDRLMRELGQASRTSARVYFTGGATAVLFGWRQATIDVDLKLVPPPDELVRAIAELKDRLSINIEFAAPDDFIPVRPGWEDRSPFIARQGLLSFHHFDLVAQALAKIERGHVQDRADVTALVEQGRVTPDDLARAFEAIAPDLYRYPAVDAPSFRRAVHAVLAHYGP